MSNMVRFLALLLFVISVWLLIYFQNNIMVSISHYDTKFISPAFALLLISIFVFGLVALVVLVASFFWRKKLINLLLVFLSVWFVFCVVELFFRYNGHFSTYLEKRDGIYRSYYDIKPVDKYLTWGNTSEHWFNCPEFKYWRPTNKYGSGEYDFDSLSKLPGIKIMALGDSFTEGDGAPYDSSWIKQLGTMLNLTDSAIAPVVTINAGICANDPVYSVMQFKDEFIQYHPDIAILAINETDVHDIKARGGLERFNPDGSLVLPGHPWWEAFYAVSHLFRFYIHEVLGYDFNFVSKAKFRKNIPVYADKLKDVVMLFTQICKQQNIRPVVAMQPWGGELKDGHYLDCLDSVRVRLLPNKEFIFVDVLDYDLRLPAGEADFQKIYWKEDHHLNSTGYNIMARAIKEKIDTFSVFKSRQ